MRDWEAGRERGRRRRGKRGKEVEEKKDGRVEFYPASLASLKDSMASETDPIWLSFNNKLKASQRVSSVT